MSFLLSYGVEFLSAAVILLLVFAVMHLLCVQKVSHTVLMFLISLYFGSVYFITGLPTVLFIRFDPSFYLLPFIGIGEDIRNSLLNILLFLPIGLLLPLASAKYKNMRSIVLYGFSFSLFIELAQIFTYRLTDINDLITNTLGAVLGFYLSKPIWKRFRSSVSLHRSDIRFTILITIGVMFFLQPLLSSMIWKLIP